MIYKFIDNQGTFRVNNSQYYNLYFPLTNSKGSLLSSLSPNLAGDIKKDEAHFLTPPVSITDIKSNLLCRRDFFINLGKKTIRLSYPYKDTLEAGFLYHKIIKKVKNLYIEILNFIPHNIPVEVMWIKMVNKNQRSLEIIPTSFIPLYGRASKNLRDHRHVSSLLNRITLDKYGIFLKPTMVFDEKGHKINKTIYFCLGFEGKGKTPIGQFPTLDYFSGQGDLIFPQAIEKELRPVIKERNEFDGKETIAAFRFRKRILKKGREANYFLIMGIDSSGKKSIKSTFRKLNTPQKIIKSFEETKKYWQSYLSAIDFDFQDKNFNNWLRWVKLQPILRKLFGNSFLPHFDYGKGGRGWRDLWQDSLTLLLTEPNKAKQLILNNFKGVRIDGSNATIISKKGEFLSDRNNISRVWMDHGIWPYLTLRLYLNKTGDLNILNKNTTYFRDHLLKRAKQIDTDFHQKDFLLHTKGGKIYKGSVLEHILIQHLTSFFNVGNHNIIRLENADWNDGLDMAREQGESVTFSFMYGHNLGDLCFFLDKLKKKHKKVTLAKELLLLLDRIKNPLNYNNFRKKQKRLEQYLEKSKNISGQTVNLAIEDLIYDLKEKSQHLLKWLQKNEWLKAGFFNGYYDNSGKRVTSGTGKNIKIMLPPQVFAIMSGVASSEQIKRAYNSIKKYLKDSSQGGFRLNTDFGSLYPQLGRAFGFSFGDKENGAFFNHMVVMLSFALYQRGFIEEGWEVFQSIYKMATAKAAEIYPGIPEYFNNSGKGLYLYLTGSASWYIYTLMQEILGVKFLLGNILLKPKLMATNFFKKDIKVTFPFARKKINLFYLRGKGSNLETIKTAILEGKKINPENNSYLIKRELLKKIKKKEINLQVYLA